MAGGIAGNNTDMGTVEPITPASLAGLLPRREHDAHKGLFGHVLVIGGQPGMNGAVRLAGEAALRTGAGLVSVATHPEHAALVSVARPELMSHGVDDAEALRRLAERATVIALGPGLGSGAWGHMLWDGALKLPMPAVVDADALNRLALSPMHRTDWILTPHAGEAARLLAVTSQDIQRDRNRAASTIAEQYGGVCVLKGAGTLVAVAGDARLYRCDAGNPGMASGGMGDVLTGVIAALVAQGLSLANAARAGVWLHATAGDRCAASMGVPGMLALDVCSALPQALQEMSA